LLFIILYWLDILAQGCW